MRDGTRKIDLPSSSEFEPDIDKFVDSGSERWRQDWMDAINRLPLLDRSAADWVDLAEGTGGDEVVLGDACASEEWVRQNLHAASILSKLPRRDRHDALEAFDWAKMETESAEWRGLLAINSDEGRYGKGWVWGDVGQLQFWIREEDLKNRRFDLAQMHLDTT